MSFLKFQADNIFTGTEALSSNHVLITDAKGKIIDIVDETIAGEDIQKFSGIISPGFINCHCHLELSHLKGKIPEHTGMVDFILNILQQRNASKEVIENAIADAEKEMIENGIVAVGDICNTNDTLFQKQKNNLYYYNFIEISGFVPSTAQQRFEFGQNIFNQFQTAIPNQNSIVPHAAYSVSDDLFTLIQYQSKNKILSIHNQESIAEETFFLDGKGDFVRLYKELTININHFNHPQKSSLLHILTYLTNASKTILVHNCTTSKKDIEEVKKQSDIKLTQFYLCLCVLANRYISNGLPDEIVFENNLENIVIGTDSFASNHSLNILEEIKTIKQAYPQTSEFDLLRFATYNGAVALNINNKFGSLSKGLQPGVILIENFTTCTKPKKLV